MVIMSEWVYGDGKRQRRGEEVSNVFSVKLNLGLAAAAATATASGLSVFLCRLTTHVTQTPLCGLRTANRERDSFLAVT